ncbi:MAG TPA: hypothetical protein QGI40_06120, partial [Nitrospinaceae bacterium]|nr:hypothetical protein [Nitrospinaceae bacterium]
VPGPINANGSCSGGHRSGNGVENKMTGNRVENPNLFSDAYLKFTQQFSQIQVREDESCIYFSGA